MKRPFQHWRAHAWAVRACCVLVILLVGFGARVASAQPDVPPLTGRVVDRADLLSDAAEQQLSTLLAAHEDSTSNQVAVLTIPSLEGAVLEQYSLRVAREWELGQEEFDNGVLLLISRDDRKMRIEVGYGLEGDLPDAIASRIIRNEITPHFRDGDFEAGIRAGVNAILDALEGTYTPPEAPDASSPVANRVMGVLFMFFGLLFGGGASYAILKAAARGGWVIWIIVLIFLGPFATGGILTAVMGAIFALFGSSPGVGAALLFFLVTPAVLIGVLVYSVILIRHPKLRAFRKKEEDERDLIDETVKVGFLTFAPSFWQRSITSSSGGSSGWSSGGSFSSGSSFGGGSSFSGGGGSFGGGGASGGW